MTASCTNKMQKATLYKSNESMGAPQNSRLHPEYIQAISHAQPQVTFTQIRVGFSNLNDDLYRKGCTDTQSCDCGHIIEDSKHLFSNLPFI